MKLIASPSCPFSRKVRIVLVEKKIECQLELINPWRGDSVILNVNPLGQVPTLILDDGTSLYDSRVIVEHLDNASPVNRLLPTDKRALTQVKRLEALSDGICEAGIAVLLETRRASGECSHAWQQRQLERVHRGLAALSEELAQKAWLRSESAYTLADMAVGSMLDWLDMRLPQLNWAQRYVNLSHLLNKLRQRPSFEDTAPPRNPSH